MYTSRIVRNTRTWRPKLRIVYFRLESVSPPPTPPAATVEDNSSTFGEIQQSPKDAVALYYGIIIYNNTYFTLIHWWQMFRDKTHIYDAPTRVI